MIMKKKKKKTKTKKKKKKRAQGLMELAGAVHFHNDMFNRL